MQFRFVFLLTVFAFVNLFVAKASAQVDSVIGQITSSGSETFAGGTSGDGRFVVFESRGNLATENPRNADGSREVFIFDYAQRRIFQITDSKSLLVDTTVDPQSVPNIKVEIVSLRPVISNDGRWIAFGSNATTSTPAVPNATNPGSFDANSFTATGGANPLTTDGNTEMWMYQIPAVPAASLTTGDEVPLTDLSGGQFIRLTNTLPSRLPRPGNANQVPLIGDDNHDASINDNGNYITFTSNRDLTPCATTATATCGNAFPNFDNDEIYSYARLSAAINQITATPRGTAAVPLDNSNSTISGNGLRVMFFSPANNPIVGMTGGTNADLNDEVYFTDLNANGAVAGNRRQVTNTPSPDTGLVNFTNYGRRMSRDGRYIAFDSLADLENTTPTVQTSYAAYLYDTTTPTTANGFRRITPRNDADPAANGDVFHYPGFTDTDANGTPATLVLESRQNFKADGTIPTVAADGLNPDTLRPIQIYSIPITTLAPAATKNFTRLTKLPAASIVIGSAQPLTSDSITRTTFNLARTEIGTGNFDLFSETFYMYIPPVDAQTAAGLNYATGASRRPVQATTVATPTPTVTPTPTGSPSPTPTPVTPPAVQGISPGSLASVSITGGLFQPVASRTAVGSLQRRFTLPIQLSGVTMTINGAACGLKSVSRREIIFVVPPGLTGSNTVYPVVINNNGLVYKGTIVIATTTPDIFTFNESPSPGGRAQVYNATNRVLTREPFTIRTRRIKGGRLVPTVLRLYVSGVQFVTAGIVTVRIGSVSITGTNITTDAVDNAPGVYTIDFTLPPALDGAGDQPIVLELRFAGQTVTSRLDDTAPRIRIL